MPALLGEVFQAFFRASQVLNQVVVWDQIISDPNQAWIRSSSVANKYSLTDQVRVC